MLGYAYQQGLVPLSADALLRAIELNETAVEANKQAFLWGRRAAVDLAKVERIAAPEDNVVVPLPKTLDALIQRRVDFLTKYQNKKYAQSYERFVRQVRTAEPPLGGDRLTRAVAENLFKLMAYKDEYEVARLYANGDFKRKLGETFDGDFSVTFHMAPPVFSKRDAKGHLIKQEFGPWMWRAFGVLAKLKFLRGTWLDPFGRTQERVIERRLIEDYRNDVTSILSGLTREQLDDAVELARLPEHIRGFGHVKQASIESARAQGEAIKAKLSGTVTNVNRPAASSDVKSGKHRGAV
jgi:indolepyruvate ferredoxin oxidoreductase